MRRCDISPPWEYPESRGRKIFQRPHRLPAGFPLPLSPHPPPGAWRRTVTRKGPPTKVAESDCWRMGRHSVTGASREKCKRRCRPRTGTSSPGAGRVAFRRRMQALPNQGMRCPQCPQSWKQVRIRVYSRFLQLYFEGFYIPGACFSSRIASSPQSSRSRFSNSSSVFTPRGARDWMRTTKSPGRASSNSTGLSPG